MREDRTSSQTHTCASINLSLHFNSNRALRARNARGKKICQSVAVVIINSVQPGRRVDHTRVHAHSARVASSRKCVPRLPHMHAKCCCYDTSNTHACANHRTQPRPHRAPRFTRYIIHTYARIMEYVCFVELVSFVVVVHWENCVKPSIDGQTRGAPQTRSCVVRLKNGNYFPILVLISQCAVSSEHFGCLCRVQSAVLRQP